MSADWSSPTLIISSHFSLIFSCFTFFTTLLAIIAYFRSATIRKSYQNLFLLNLLVNSLLWTMFTIGFYGFMSYMKSSDIFSIGWVCNLNAFGSLYFASVEIYTVACIATERWFAIKKQKQLSRKHIIAFLVFGYTSIPFVVG
jgi:hypothetical protein